MKCQFFNQKPAHPTGAPRNFGPWSDRMKKVVRRTTHTLLLLSVTLLTACQDLTPHHPEQLIKPTIGLSEIVGFLAGLGTTFAAVPDLIAMLKRQSSLGMNPRMGAINGAFQVLWVYYGLLIASRPVIAWNVIAVCINFVTVGAYAYFFRKEKAVRGTGSA
jgi:MtN3 and saliva related transmembrane protein